MSVCERVGRDGVAVREVTDDPSVEVRDALFERWKVGIDEWLGDLMGVEALEYACPGCAKKVIARK